ncbi:hypothetical protein AWW67_01520 [Roseivirga seohaensis]|uniref:AprE-like beta-barrel domain-containing protein n=1 Tax=Roseivirga seohaensis TaxID=1914963 RepID=A0A150Y1A6_9BACT|nr:HlyD family efflux transporter periplasmic adaptor subunit [Roseivirga seohaensis]KYG84751.1 hypothetical protein AWW67_01520 [Roseivirga seohaensis]
MIFPKEILENTSQAFNYKNQVRSNVIFILASFIIIAGLGATPFLKTDIYVSANGIIKPNKERRNLVAPVTGFLETYNLKDNQEVLAGDTLLKLDNSRVTEQIQKIEAEKRIVEDNLADLNYLIFAKEVDRNKLQLPTNRTNYLKFEQKLRELDLRMAQSTTILDRQERLFDEGVISIAEYQKVTFENNLLQNEKELLIKDQRYFWESERKSETQKILEFESSATALKRNLNEYFLLAPISGTLFNVKGFEVSGYINAGEVVAEISPSTDLIVETYISPSDIGLITLGAGAKYQIDAYNYNNWGLASGNIIEISNDLEVINNAPVFKVRSSLDQSQLSLRNGFVGDLKKGLTLRARYHITERSLFDLLYDKVDDWLNPAQNNTPNQNLSKNGLY